MNDLLELWLKPELLDLKNYFWKKNELLKKLEEFAWVYVSWWNAFVLTQAYHLSWFWKIIQEYENKK